VPTDGKRISLDTLRGRIVLLDFWAHANDPFSLVGISADREEGAWRSFIGKNGMIWPQHWERDHQLRSLFRVQVIPTYVLIDGRGRGTAPRGGRRLRPSAGAEAIRETHCSAEGHGVTAARAPLGRANSTAILTLRQIRVSRS
jgi:hypothetical protein